MNKQRVALCGQCIALARDAYQVTESTGAVRDMHTAASAGMARSAR